MVLLESKRNSIIQVLKKMDISIQDIKVNKELTKVSEIDDPTLLAILKSANLTTTVDSLM